MHLPLDEIRWQMEVNLLGQLNVTQKFLPLLGAVPNAPHPPGRIINISSVSGKVVYPFMGAVRRLQARPGSDFRCAAARTAHFWH